MARVIGVDLGAYSVKVVVSTPSFRGVQISELIEERIPEGDEPHLIRACAVVGNILRRVNATEDAVYASIAGDKVFLHVLEFEFKSLKRADLERAVGAELEGVLPIDLEDMVYAFEEIPKLASANLPAEGEDEPTFVGGAPVRHGRIASAAVGMRILAAATQRTRAEELLVALRGQGVDPNGLLASPAPYARLAAKLTENEGDADLAVLDVGHLRTDFCLAKGGRPIFARSIARGGHHLTQEIAKTWKMDYGKAELAKHQSGFLASAVRPAQTEEAVAVSDCLSKQMRILVRELQRTLNACAAKTGYRPEKIVLLGGGSRVPGMAEFLSEQLGLDVSQLREDSVTKLLGTAAANGDLDSSALALGIAMDGASAKPTFDLRQGALAYRADASFLRSKVRSLAIAGAAITIFGLLSAYTGVNKLKTSKENLNHRLALESMEAFGESLGAADVLDKVGPVEMARSVSPIPDMTAYDMFLAFNEDIPKKDKVVLDVREFVVEDGKVTVKATSTAFGETSALQGIKNLEEALKNSDCFDDFASPESQPGKGEKETRDFTLSIRASCKGDSKAKKEEE